MNANQYLKRVLVCAVVMFSLFFAMIATAQTSAIPKNAYEYLPLIYAKTDELFPDIPYRAYVPALVHHESCITNKHPKCFNPKARLKTAREEGGGFGQLTKAYKKDGSLRFDMLDEMRKLHKEQLRELSWQNLYTRPDLQASAMVLMVRDLYKGFYAIEDDFQRTAMMDASYNGGRGGVMKERRYCGLKKGCDPNVWFGNVEKYCLKSKSALYGKRSACDINRHHVKDVLKVKLPIYQNYEKLLKSSS